MNFAAVGHQKIGIFNGHTWSVWIWGIDFRLAHAVRSSVLLLIVADWEYDYTMLYLVYLDYFRCGILYLYLILPHHTIVYLSLIWSTNVNYQMNNGIYIVKLSSTYALILDTYTI
jgi:hypothetical protein